MHAVLKRLNRSEAPSVFVSHLDARSADRPRVEQFIAGVFARRYAARVSSLAPNLILLQDRLQQIIAAAGWRPAQAGPLFLEHYLDDPIEHAMGSLNGQPVRRESIVEVGNLATGKSGASVHVILALAEHLDRLGYEWVVFTATRELIGIFQRLGLPLLALAKADPARLGDEARHWGSYYDREPVVVAGRICLGLERFGRRL